VQVFAGKFDIMNGLGAIAPILMSVAYTSAPVPDLTVDPRSSHWLTQALALLRDTGMAIILDVVSPADCARARAGVARVESGQGADIPTARLREAAARGDRDLRLLPPYDPFFFKFLEFPEQLAVIDAYLSPSAILRFQQASIIAAGRDPSRPGPWHMNFRRVLNGYRAALEVGFAIDGVDPGSYYFALGSHQRAERPDSTSLSAMARTFPIPPGSMFVFDGTLWHHEGDGAPPADRLLILHEFVPHFVKPHLDFVRVLGAATVEALAPRTRRLLGWESRVPASLEEFYRDPAERLYLPDQG
jgi:ectoine hydroxylase-related dioxygenase (phytanoyl-CoA dioxygenase family)